MKMNLQEIKQMADQMKDSMEKLIKMTDQALNNLPSEERKNVAPIQQDIHSVLNAVKEGDTTKIHEISKKYAGFNTK